MNDPAEMLSRYYALMAANGADRVYREAVSSGLLDALLETPQSTEALATATDAKPRPVGLVCAVLESLGLLTRNGEAWVATPLARTLLSGAYRELGDPYWIHLPDFLATDEPITQMDDPTQSEAHYRRQAEALGWMLAPAAEAAAALLAKTLTAVERCAILDAGAGSAVWSLALAERLPQAQVTAADWPGVLELAKAHAERRGLADRLTLLPGDLAEADLPDDAFDLAILGNVTHLLPLEHCTALFAKLHATLKPGGRLIVFDIFPGLTEGDLNRTLYALGLALRTRAGRVHSAADLSVGLERVGLSQPTLTPLDVMPHTLGMLTADKAAAPH